MACKLQQLGHVVRVIPAQFVKPCVKSNKNNIIDAEAIAEAATRPTKRFVGIKSEAQVDIQAPHRIRDQEVALRTQLVCQMRASIAIHQDIGNFKAGFPRVLTDEGNDLMRLFDFGYIEHRIAPITCEIEASAASCEQARRLLTVPGRGPLAARVGQANRQRAYRGLQRSLSGRMPQRPLIPIPCWTPSKKVGTRRRYYNRASEHPTDYVVELC